MPAPALAPLLYTRPALFARVDLTRPHMPPMPMLVRAKAQGQYSAHTPHTRQDHDGHATAALLGLLDIRTNGGPPFHPEALLSSLLDVPRSAGGWRTFTQIVIPTPYGRASLEGTSFLKEHCTHPDYTHTSHTWWMGRACLIGVPSQAVQGQWWKDAPASLHDTPILPVFRLPVEGDSAHIRLRDTRAIAHDLALLAHTTARSLSYPHPFSNLLDLHTTTPSA